MGSCKMEVVRKAAEGGNDPRAPHPMPQSNLIKDGWKMSEENTVITAQMSKIKDKGTY